MSPARAPGVSAYIAVTAAYWAFELTDAERAEQDELHASVIATLEELGLTDLVPKVDDNLFGAAIDRRVPEATQQAMGRMLEIGGPLAIFVTPPDTVDP